MADKYVTTTEYATTGANEGPNKLKIDTYGPKKPVKQQPGPSLWDAFKENLKPLGGRDQSKIQKP